MLTPPHWLLGQGELSARLWTPRISIEVMRGGVSYPPLCGILNLGLCRTGVSVAL